MTRISKKTIAVTASGLLAVAITGSVLAQQLSGGERYARALQEADITARYNVQLEQQLGSQTSEIASLEQQIAELDATAFEVQGMLQRMFDELAEFVANDLPFFAAERSERIDRLRGIMESVETSPSEKYRRLMEAYQIEMEYGRTMSSYEEELSDGRAAEFVRLGRVTLLYRTTDGTESGYWDKNQNAWVPDPDSARAIEDALGMAKEQKAPDLVIVPVPAPQGGRS